MTQSDGVNLLEQSGDSRIVASLAFEQKWFGGIFLFYLFEKLKKRAHTAIHNAHTPI